MSAVMVLLFDVGRSATILSVLEGKTTPTQRPQDLATSTPIAYRPLSPSTLSQKPPLSTDLTINYEPTDTVCEKKSAIRYIERDGCRPAVLLTKECTGLTVSVQAFVGFNDTMPGEMTVKQVCTPIKFKRLRRKLTFVCNGKVKVENVYFHMPTKCGIVTQKPTYDRPPLPTQEPPLLITTTPDC